MNLLDQLTFNRVFVINLQRDADRLERFYQQLPSDWPFPRPIRFPATDGNLVPMPAWWQAGSAAWGCFRSHTRIIEEALQNETESLLILEDDAVFVDSFSTHLSAFARELPDDWEFIYLGGQHIRRDEGIPVQISENVYRPYNVHRCHAYGLRGRPILERIYQHLNSPDQWGPGNHLDHRMGELQHEYEGGVYVPSHWMVGQGAGFSNIKKKHLAANFFPDTREVCEPRIPDRMLAVVGPSSPPRLAVASALHKLGVAMGEAREPNVAWKGPTHYCAPALDKICQSLFTKPWLIEKTNTRHRISQLRFWASKRLDGDRSDVYLGGSHATFCLLAEELAAAWNRPFVVMVEAPSHPLTPPRGWQIREQLLFRQGWEQFREQDFARLLRIDPAQIHPDTTVDLVQSMAAEIGITATSEQCLAAGRVLAQAHAAGVFQGRE